LQHQIGYENPNSFLRAFRVWEGVTPTEWRAMQKAGLQETPEATAINRRRQILV